MYRQMTAIAPSHDVTRNYQGLASNPCYLIQRHLNNTTECHNHKQLLDTKTLLVVDCLVTISLADVDITVDVKMEFNVASI